jgi:Holliday junction resolvase-like predicted endonuclease
MAILLPNSFEEGDPKRNGEHLVYQWLSADDIPGYAFYSMLQKNHTYKIIGEVDFLYVCERGLLCIEVKGGQRISRKDRKWYSLSKSNNEYEIHNPFLQAQDCMFALKRYIIDKYGSSSTQSKYLLGYAVICPECKFTGDGNDLVTEVMFDADYSLSDFPVFLNKVFNY